MTPSLPYSTTPRLLIKLDFDDTPKFIEAIDRTIAKPWSRDLRQPHPGDDEHNMVFYRGRFGDPDSLALNLYRTDSETLETGCIKPYDFDLTPDRYQSFINEFHQTVLNPILNAGFTIAVMPRSGPVPIQRLMSPAVFAVLQHFIMHASKASDSLNPRDQTLWLRWLVVLRYSRHRVEPADIDQWARTQGFSEGAATHLRTLFESSLQLLKLHNDFLLAASRTGSTTDH